MCSILQGYWKNSNFSTLWNVTKLGVKKGETKGEKGPMTPWSKNQAVWYILIYYKCILCRRVSCCQVWCETDAQFPPNRDLHSEACGDTVSHGEPYSVGCSDAQITIALERYLLPSLHSSHFYDRSAFIVHFWTSLICYSYQYILNLTWYMQNRQCSCIAALSLLCCEEQKLSLLYRHVSLQPRPWPWGWSR